MDSHIDSDPKSRRRTNPPRPTIRLGAGHVARSVLGLANDTIRQSASRPLSWLLLGFCLVGVLFCLSIGIEGGAPLQVEGQRELYGPDGRPLTGPDPNAGRLTLGFGAFRVGLFRDGPAMVRFLQALFASWIAGAAGTLLAVIWAAGVLPESLRPSTATVLMAKPVPRWAILAGRGLGTVSEIAAGATLLIVGGWLAIGLRTGIWPPGFLVALPLLLLNFLAIYAASTVLAVWSRHASACIFGALAFWAVCFAVNYGHHAAHVLPALAQSATATPSVSAPLMELAYWILPKPADLAILLDRVADPENHLRLDATLTAAHQLLGFRPGLSVLTTLLATAALFAAAARGLGRIEY